MLSSRVPTLKNALSHTGLTLQASTAHTPGLSLSYSASNIVEEIHMSIPRNNSFLSIPHLMPLKTPPILSPVEKPNMSAFPFLQDYTPSNTTSSLMVSKLTPHIPSPSAPENGPKICLKTPSSDKSVCGLSIVERRVPHTPKLSLEIPTRPFRVQFLKDDAQLTLDSAMGGLAIGVLSERFEDEIVWGHSDDDDTPHYAPTKGRVPTPHPAKSQRVDYLGEDAHAETSFGL